MTPDEQREREERHLVYLLTRLDEHIRIELDLAGQRMNVLAVSQAFLFTAFTTAMLVADSATPALKRLQRVLLLMIPLLGTAISVIVGLALCAAIFVVRKRKQEREGVRNLLRVHVEAVFPAPSRELTILEHVQPGSWPHRLGNYPPLFLAPVIAACWVVLSVNVAFP